MEPVSLEASRRPSDSGEPVSCRRAGRGQVGTGSDVRGLSHLQCGRSDPQARRRGQETARGLPLGGAWFVPSRAPPPLALCLHPFRRHGGPSGPHPACSTETLPGWVGDTFQGRLGSSLPHPWESGKAPPAPVPPPRATPPQHMGCRPAPLGLWCGNPRVTAVRGRSRGGSSGCPVLPTPPAASWPGTWSQGGHRPRPMLWCQTPLCTLASSP